MYQPDPSKRAMTKEEYEARAMLLGMEYFTDTHTFVGPEYGVEYDADTMETVPQEETGERMREWLANRSR